MNRLTLFFLLLTSCALFSKAREENLPKVQVGQTQQELIEIMGEPDKRLTENNEEKWYYDVTSADNRRSDPYTAVFEKGLLKRWFFDTARNAPGGPASGKHRGKKTEQP